MSNADDVSSLSSEDAELELSAEDANLALLQDILSAAILTHIAQTATSVLSKHARKKTAGRKNRNEVSSSPVQNQEPPFTERDAGDLADFIEYLATELFTSLPPELRALTQQEPENEVIKKTRERYTSPLAAPTLAALVKPIPLDVHEGIQTCLSSSLPDTPATALSTRILEHTLDAYLEAINPAPPPAPPASDTSKPPPKPRPPPKPASGCELCARTHIPLTMHHLIPRATHAKAVKRGWHSAEACQTAIAWLCRACHSFVHGFAGNDELAREWFAVERIREREDVQRWVAWVGRVRWKAR